TSSSTIDLHTFPTRRSSDLAMPISEPVVKRYLNHHRLQKKDPAAAMSEPVKAIVYYVDRGAPEPVRSALIEGASWWNQAFEAARSEEHTSELQSQSNLVCRL